MIIVYGFIMGFKEFLATYSWLIVIVIGIVFLGGAWLDSLGSSFVNSGTALVLASGLVVLFLLAGMIQHS